MKNRQLIGLVLIPLLGGVCAYALARSLWPSEPRIEAPAVIDLGPQEKGNVVTVAITIRNTGGKQLELRDFCSSCTCLALEQKTTSGFDRLQHAEIPPGQELSAIARVNVVGMAGGPFQALIQFQTNDPSRPSAKVEIVAQIEGRILPFPAELNLGSLRRGHQLTRTVELRNAGRSAPCIPARVESSDPAHIRVIALRRKQGLADPGGPALGTPVAEVEVEVVSPAAAGPLDGRLLVFEEGGEQPLLTIPVRGVVMPRIQVSPSAVVLPRVTGEGLAYSMTCFCRSTEDKPLQLVLEQAPPGLVVSIPSAEGSAAPIRMVTLEWQPSPGAAEGKPQTATVRLKAMVEDVAEIVEIPVICRRPD